MTAYATSADVAAGFRELDADEQVICEQLLLEAGVIIDEANADADDDIKKVVSCRMVRRALGTSGDTLALPLGTTQGSMTAGVYTQSFTVSNGSLGELYLGRTEKRLLGIADRLGAYSPVEGMVTAL